MSQFRLSPTGPRRRASRHVASRPLAALLLALAAIGPVPATLIRPLSLEETAGAADRIVLGKVASTRVYWEGGMLWTEVTLSVGRTLKGAAEPRVTLIQPGGRVESPVPLEIAVPGAPMHTVGDEGYYFLEPRGPGKRVIVGMHLGQVLLRADDRGPFVSFGGRRQTPAGFEAAVLKALQSRGGAGGRP
ncbi:MAG: hypothetical protein ACRD6R_09750 [Candidatus Polarisedimenticolia bacterium]